jgi:hypothetical protein
MRLQKFVPALMLYLPRLSVAGLSFGGVDRAQDFSVFSTVESTFRHIATIFIKHAEQPNGITYFYCQAGPLQRN